MVRNYVRTTTRCQLTEEDLRSAIKEVEEKQLSIRKAAAKYHIPLTTLQRRNSQNNRASPKLGRFKSVFAAEEETILLEHILDMQKKLYGLTADDLKRLAFSVAEMLKIDHPFNKTKQKAGDDWLYQFIKRNPDLVLRTPERTSIARVKRCNRKAINEFFNVLEEAHTKHSFEPRNIYNIDETGVNSVHNPRKIFAEKGTKQVGKAVSGEREKNITVCCSMSASGTFIPQFFIFYQMKMDQVFMRNAFLGSQGITNGSGWMDSPTFLLYLEHFIKHAKPTQEDPVLVILDGHSSHKSLEVIQKCRENFISLVTLPPHTSHRTQPGPVKSYFSKECDRFMSEEKDGKITHYDIVGLFSKALVSAAKVDSAIKGFKKSGICPKNRDIFEDADFYEDSSQPEILSQPEIHPPPDVPLSSDNASQPVPSTSCEMTSQPENWPTEMPFSEIQSQLDTFELKSTTAPKSTISKAATRSKKSRASKIPRTPHFVMVEFIYIRQ